jgi:carboxypeptidase PM20D1
MKRIALTGVMVLVLIAGLMLYRTLQIPTATSFTALTPAKLVQINADESAKHLAEAIRFRTVSTQNPADFNPAAFLGLQAWMRQTYPQFYAAVKTEMVDTYSQLNTWQGSDVSLQPIVFMAHMDVVPASETLESGWQKPPFDGLIEDGFIWGRGTIDDKGALIGLLEAADRLAASGFTPKRTLIFAFGHNEEVLGSGAEAIAHLLKVRGIHPYAVIDEGGAITTNMPDAKGPVARIGVSEKGYVTLILTAKAKGGHSSAPSSRTAIGELSRAIVAVEAHPFQQKIDPVIAKMLRATAPEQSFTGRMIVANLWLFRPLVTIVMKKSKTGRAMLGTTIAPTIIKAGFKENALPRTATAYINFRIHARDSVQSLLAHVRKAIDNPQIVVRIADTKGTEPSPVSQIDAGPYLWLSGVISEAFPDTIIAPNVVLGGTDSRYFSIITDDIYRFIPYTLDSSDISRFHGLNERLGVKTFAHGIQAYYLMLEQAGILMDQ